MNLTQNTVNLSPVSVFRKLIVDQEYGDQYVFYRHDDIDSEETYGVGLSTLLEFVEKCKSAGGLRFFYSEVIVKGMAKSGEFIKEIVAEDGSVLWTSS